MSKIKQKYYVRKKAELSIIYKVLFFLVHELLLKNTCTLHALSGGVMGRAFYEPRFITHGAY